MAAKKARASRSKKPAAEPRGLQPTATVDGKPPAPVGALAAQVESDGGAVVGTWRDPLGGQWQLLVVLPIDKVQPTPFQRDLSATHVKRLTERIDQLNRFLDPIIAVRRADGSYWTSNGNHRLHAMRALAVPSITCLLVPDETIAYQILALNTEKAHNLREKAMEVIRMARDLATSLGGTEQDHALMFEDPELLTLGICYEQNGRFAGGVYRPVLRRLESFLALPMAKALAERERRAAQLQQLDETVAAAVARLKAQGLESPYLKNFVVARCNPLRFAKDDATPEFDATLARMIAAAAKFDAKKIGAEDVAAAGGGPAEE
ncbi:MAG: ParB N-terminal domain-containing protein [Planctomycetes bacterium]|nr:ParB N-terminal domain-containing protein [Planctomycetota bacterium]